MKVLIKNQQRHRLLNKTKITKTARQILSLLELPSAELSILFVGDRKMTELNYSYRGIRKSTDVLSFEAAIPLRESGADNVLGDIVISVPKAESQAEDYGMVFYDEIYRLMIHGILHLSGHDHEGSEYLARKMRKKEEEIFNAVKKVDTKR